MSRCRAPPCRRDASGRGRGVDGSHGRSLDRTRCRPVVSTGVRAPLASSLWHLALLAADDSGAVGGPRTAVAVGAALIAPVTRVSQRLVRAAISRAMAPPLGCGAPVPAAPGPWQPGCQLARLALQDQSKKTEYITIFLGGLFCIDFIVNYIIK